MTALEVSNMNFNLFLLIFLVTILLSLFMSCYVAAVYALALAKAHKVPHTSSNLGFALLFLIPGINLLLGMLLAVSLSSSQVLDHLMLNADNMTEDEIEKFDNNPKLSTAIRIFHNH